MIKASHKRDLATIIGKRWTDLHVPVHSAAYILNPSFVRYPIFDDKSIIDDFKEFVRDCGFNTAKALQELERYRVHFSPEGASIYAEYGNLQTLPNPLTYWRYYAESEMDVLPKIAKVIYNILASSSICEQSFRDHEYIYSNRRLRTNMERFNKLVFLFSNRGLK